MNHKLFLLLIISLISCAFLAQVAHASTNVVVAPTTTSIAHPCLPAVGKFKTYTQVELGAVGTAANAFLVANFGKCFGSSGLVVGADVNIDLLNILDLSATLKLGLTSPPALKFTSAAAVTSFLPQLGVAGCLIVDLLNPLVCPAGLLGGDLVALHLNVAFDEVFPSFGAANFNLTELVFVKGPCVGLSVGAVLDIANQVVSGCIPPALVADPLFIAANIDACVASVNSNFLDGVSVGAFLALPGLHLQANLDLFLQLPQICTGITATCHDLLSLQANAHAALQVILGGIAVDANLCLASGIPYNAWKLDLGVAIDVNAALAVDAFVISSLKSSITGVAIDAWVNIDLLALVNYVLNFHGISVHAAVDIQAAILCLLNPSLSIDACISAAGLTSSCNRAIVAAIVADARLNGVGFVPACGQIVGVIAKIQVSAGVFAHVLIEVVVPNVDISISSSLCIDL